jgi:tetratricopeptide (TPR) repeat protein
MSKLSLFYSVLLLVTPGLAIGQDKDKSDPQWEQIRRVAETQHDIVALAIRQGNYNQVLPELRKILQLKFPPKYESTLSQEIEIVADALMHKEKYDLALQCIDEGLRCLTTKANKARILRRKAYILVKEGKEDEALRYFRQAVELSRNGSQ